MRPYRWAGLVGLAIVITLGVLFLAAAAGPAVQAGSPVSYQLRLPLVLQPPRPIFLPAIFKSPPSPAVDLSVGRIEVIQGVAMSGNYTVQVAGRPALMRVFVGLAGASVQAGVVGRLTRYVGGAAQDSLDAGPIIVLGSTSEGSLAETLNFNLPDSWLSPGTSYVIELDPNNAIPESNKNINRYPSSGEASFNFQSAPTLEVVIVPVTYARPGAPVTTPPTGDLSYLTWMPFKVYPVSRINYTVRSSPLMFTGDLRIPDGWSQLLNDVTNVHGIEDLAEHKEYFGLVDSVGADGCNGGCMAGVGWINAPPPDGYVSKSAVGFAGFTDNRSQASPIMTHEMGHTFGRYHSPCGTTSALGPFPYPGASIGQWGYDNAAGQLLSPDTYRDFMSYCDPAWTSDFTYQAVFNAWSWVSNPFPNVAPSDQADALVIDGSFDPADQWLVSPAHVQSVLRSQLSSAGALRLELTDAAGRVLRTQPFASVPMAVDLFRTGFYRQGFRLALPVTPGAAGFRIYRDDQLLYQRLSKGPAPVLGPVDQTVLSSYGAQLGWTLTAGPAGVTYRVRFSPDGGQTWQVLAVDQAALSITLPPGLLAAASQPILEVQASDGVRTATRAYPMSQH